MTAAQLGPRCFPSECCAGDSGEQPRGQGDTGREKLYEGWRKKSSFNESFLPAAGTTVGWLRGPEARAGAPAAPLPHHHRNWQSTLGFIRTRLCLTHSTGGKGPSPLTLEYPEAEPYPCIALSQCPRGWCQHQESRKPTIKLIIVVVTFISLKMKPAPRHGMTQPRPHAAGRAGTGTLGSWVHSLPCDPGGLPCNPDPHLCPFLLQTICRLRLSE